VVVPYERFYQSGIVARAFEKRVPVVAPRQSQTESLYGSGYVGLVSTGESWSDAVAAVLNNPNLDWAVRFSLVNAESADAWQSLASGASRPLTRG
jgi:hypothetical protein